MTEQGTACLFNLSEFPRLDHEPLVVEFYAGDILSKRSDALIVSSFRGSYHPPGSILGALYRRFGIAFGSELPHGTVSVHPRLHLFPAPPCPSFSQLWVIEVKDIMDPDPPSLADISAAFSILKSRIQEITARGATSVSMPLIDTGDVGFDTHEVAWKTLELIRYWASSCPAIRLVRVFTREVEKFATLNLTIDKFFGSQSEPAASLLLHAAHEELSGAIKLLRIRALAAGLQELSQMTEMVPASPKSIALLGQRLAETCAKMLSEPLAASSPTLSQLLAGPVQEIVQTVNQRWILSYFRLLQHCGNAAAHEQGAPLTLTDAAAVTVAVLRVAEFSERHLHPQSMPRGT
jgi:hypothetical protein